MCKITYNLGLNNGWLKAIARINDKTDHGYDFVLETLSDNNTSLEEALKRRFNDICETFEFKKIKNAKIHLKKVLLIWFYEFQKHQYNTQYLEDKNDNFSLSDNEWRIEWVEEFVNLLLSTTKCKELYNVKIGRTKGFYVCDSSEIIIVGKNSSFHLHLSVSD